MASKPIAVLTDEVQELDGCTDEQLAERLRGGDRRAGDLLMTRHQRLVARAVCEVIRDLAAVQDLIQEAFLKAFRKIHLFDASMGRFTLWLTTIARNETINHLRRLKRSRLVLSEDLPPQEEASPIDRPSQQLSKKETWSRIVGAIRSFREPDRMILHLRILESKPFAEIARTLGQPLDTVKSTFYRAMTILRQRTGLSP